MTTNTPAAAPITADNESIAQRAIEIDEELRRDLPPNTDFADGWQQRYLDRQNARFEQALEMARQEAALSASVATPRAASGVDAEWVEKAERLSDNAIKAHASWFAERTLGELSNSHMHRLNSEKDAARAALRAHINTALAR